MTDMRDPAVADDRIPGLEAFSASSINLIGAFSIITLVALVSPLCALPIVALSYVAIGLSIAILPAALFVAVLYYRRGLTLPERISLAIAFAVALTATGSLREFLDKERHGIESLHCFAFQCRVASQLNSAGMEPSMRNSVLRQLLGAGFDVRQILRGGPPPSSTGRNPHCVLLLRDGIVSCTLHGSIRKIQVTSSTVTVSCTSATVRHE